MQEELWFGPSCNLKDDIIASKSVITLLITICRVFVLLIPYHFDLLKGHNLYVRCYDKTENLSPTLEYAKSQNTISTKEISGEWEGGDS